MATIMGTKYNDNDSLQLTDTFPFFDWFSKLRGSGEDDQIHGKRGNDVLLSYGGNDVLDGGTGADYMEGGPGNDTYFVHDAADTVVEYAGQGTDLVWSVVNYTLPNHVENLALYNGLILDENGETYTFSPPSSGTGNALNNIIVGNSIGNTLNGRDGNDRLEGDEGSDTVEGGLGQDSVYGGDGNDLLYGDGTFCEGNSGIVDDDLGFVTTPLCETPGDNEGDYIDGGEGNDTLYGEWGSDILNGGAGDDRLQGYQSDSVLQVDEFTGGPGADIFILGDTSGAFYLDNTGIASISDFDWRQGDKFQVHGSLEDYAVAPFFSGASIAYQEEVIAVVANTDDVLPYWDFIFV